MGELTCLKQGPIATLLCGGEQAGCGASLCSGVREGKVTSWLQEELTAGWFMGYQGKEQKSITLIPSLLSCHQVEIFSFKGKEKHWLGQGAIRRKVSHVSRCR